MSDTVIISETSNSVVVASVGVQGAAGLSIRYGAVAPTTEGVDGDFYINTATSMLYGPKAAGVWPSGVSLIGPQGVQGIQGIQGIAGFTLLHGAVNPTVEGNNGDFYINIATNFIYGPKAAGTWPSGVSLVGPQGIQGATGPANSLAIGTVTSGPVAASITGAAPSQTLNLVLPVSSLYNLYLAANYI